VVQKTGSTSVGILSATDPDIGESFSFSLADSAGSRFEIVDNRIVVAQVNLLNFEEHSSHTVVVRVEDSAGNAIQRMLTINVADVNESPTITSEAKYNVAENTMAVTTVTATDPDAGTALSYSISGGADAAKFSINASTGALTFLASPDFEAPTDAGINNIYDVQVSVSDGVNAPVAQDIAVTVTNVNESPAITSGAAFNVAENSTAVTTVTATDSDAGATLIYSISGGADAAKFSINSSTGALTFLAAPDFETPTDAGLNNIYDVQIRVTDGVTPVIQNIAVTVTNVDETTGALTYSLASGVLSVVGTSGDDVITVYNDAGAIKIDSNGSIIDTGATAAAVTGVSISGLGGNDTLKIDLSLGAALLGSLLGGDGNDLLISGRGNDLLDGGAGDDEVTFIQAASGVNVYLATTGPQNTAGAGTDRLVQVENVTGSNFNDSLFGNAGSNRLFGGGGNDSLDGLGGADSLDGGIGNDTLTFDNLDTSVVGGADNDRSFVASGSGAVSYNLVSGQMEIVYATNSTANNLFDATGATFAVTVIGGSGNDTILGGNANDNLSGGAGADSLSGGSGNDTLDGGTEADALDAGAGADTLNFDNLDTSVVGGADADRSFVTGATGAVNYNLATGQMEIVYAQSSTFHNVFDATGAAFGVSIYGGSGNDTITGGNLNDVLSGGGGNDSLTGNAGNDSLDGGTGADSLDGGIGADSLTFDNFDVSVIGGAEVDRAFISGATTGVNYNLATGLMEIIYAQSSTLPNTFDATGATFQVVIYGGSGNDTIIGGDQNDVLSGGSGDDLLIGNLGNDNLDGGTGIDTVSYVTAGSSVNVNLATFNVNGGAGVDSIFNFENVTGSNFDDVITGNALDNILDGGAGLDIIFGGGGIDTII
jgi:Ca2+-binding RTX toxin-like protein